MSIFDVNYTKDEWIKYGRKNTLNLLLEHEYGFIPKECEKPLLYKCIEKKVNSAFIVEKIEMRYNNHPMFFYLYYSITQKTLKTFITVLHPLRKTTDNLVDEYDKLSSFCPIKDIIKENFAVALLDVSSVASDDINGKNSGIFKEINSNVSNSSWGVLCAWAWACSKVLDYLCIREEFDENHVSVIGHSRGGKTALLASAIDERFFLAISNCSGNSGAALSRNSSGETIKDIVKRFPYWFNENYKKYADNEGLLPFDQHHLLAIIAPRHLYISSASKDNWAYPEGELKSCIYASEYYKLFDKSGIVVPNLIENDVSYHDGMIGYHIKNSGHDLKENDWKRFIDYIKKHTQ